MNSSEFSRGRATVWYAADLAFTVVLLLAWYAFANLGMGLIVALAVVGAAWVWLRIAIGRAKAAEVARNASNSAV